MGAPVRLKAFLSRPHLRLITLIGVIVPRRLRSDFRQEWEAELRYREHLLAEWDRLDFSSKFDLLRRSTSAFWDALSLQPRRLEDEMFQDLRYALRMLVKNPGFSAVIVLTLALGIGANAALFSVVNGVLLSPLPYPQPEQLVSLHQSKPNFATGAIPYPNFRDWQRENRTFAAMAISRPASFSLLGAGEAERVSGRWVSDTIFTVLGVEPALGRSFARGEDERGAAPVAIISAGLWQRKFNSAPDAIGKGLMLDDKSYTIIGVLPSGFTLFRNTDVYVPIGQWGTRSLENRGAALGLHGIGRIRAGVTLDEARADMDRVMRDLAERYPDVNRGNGAAVVPLKERLIGDVGPVLWTLLGAVGFVLLIACVNVSNLLLARSTARTREFAIRAALGAGRWRLLRQMLTESLLLSVAGGALGLLVAALSTRAAIGMLPTALPRADEIALDARVLLFTLLVSLLTGALAGLSPALKISRWRLAESLKEGGRGSSGGRHRAQGLLVAVEMALALVLLVGAGLMLRSLGALWRVDPGFRPENALVFGISFPPSMRAGDPAAMRANLRNLSDELGSLPGVRAVSFTSGAFPLLSEDDLYFWRDDRPRPASTSEMQMSLIYRVEPGYLQAMGIPLKQGRFFTAEDDERSRPVAVIDEVFARTHFPDESPLGKRINLGDDRGGIEIVGVVGHVKQWSIDANESESLQAQLYEPFRQTVGNPSGVGVVVRTESAEGVSSALIGSIRRLVQGQNRDNIIYRMQTLNEAIAASLARHRFSMILLGAFAATALVLASIGLYGVISYLVGERRHEFGIRLALGAQSRDVLSLVLGQGVKMAMAGAGLGLLSALGLTRLLSNLLYGVSAYDPLTFAAITLLLLLVAIAACALPAWRATRVDPIAALRDE